MYQLRYRHSDNKMELVTERGNRKILADCISSKPKNIPKGLKAIF